MNDHGSARFAGLRFLLRPRLRHVLAVALLAFAACDSDEILAPSGTTTTNLAEARAKWRSQAPARYEYTLRRSCFCVDTRPMRVTVNRGVVESVRPEGSSSPIPAAERASYPSIEGLFDLVDEEIRRPASDVRATYDSARGFPIEIFLDIWAMVADDEVFYEIGNIRVRSPTA